jgi:hypothetical protein
VRRPLLAGLVYAVAACAFTWPLFLHPASLFGAIDPAGDPSLNLWTLTWDLRTISTHPTWLLTGRVFDAPMFFPARHALAYSDHLLLQALAVWPVYALTHDPVVCYNFILVASLVASAVAMDALVRTITGDTRAALVAGLIYGFAPYHFTHLLHLQLQALYFLPLSLMCLHRVLAGGRARDVVWLGVVAGRVLRHHRRNRARDLRNHARACDAASARWPADRARTRRRRDCRPRRLAMDASVFPR